MPRSAWPTERLDAVGDVLASARRSSALTQAAVAEHLGVSVRQIKGIEGGTRVLPAHLLGRLSALYGLAPGELGRRVDAAVRGFHSEGEGENEANPTASPQPGSK